MEKVLSDYLEKMEKHLKPVAVSERVDIIKEIKSEMQELQSNGVPAEKMIERLGNPKDLAKAYLGDLLSKESSISWNRFLTVCAFHSLVGFSGIIGYVLQKSKQNCKKIIIIIIQRLFSCYYGQSVMNKLYKSFTSV